MRPVTVVFAMSRFEMATLPLLGIGLSGAAGKPLRPETGPEFRLRGVTVRPMRSPREIGMARGLVVGVEERPQFRSRSEIWDWVERLQGRSEGVRQ